MSSITPRIPEIDWNMEVPRHWVKGNPSCTNFFNALSFMFPQGERFAIESARSVMAEMKSDLKTELRCSVESFIMQEAAHTHQHEQYNSTLQSFGFKNIIYNYTENIHKNIKKHVSALTRLCFVCTYEHYAAIIGNYILSNKEIFSESDSKMTLLWCWHAAEEVEHKSVCFDLYHAAGGGWLRRIFVFFLVTIEANISFFLLWLYLLWKDGCLHPKKIFSTFSDSIRFFLGKKGFSIEFLRYGCQYLKPSFHPSKHDERCREKMTSWFAANQEKLRSVPVLKK